MLSFLFKIKDNWHYIVVIISLLYGLYEAKENSILQAKLLTITSKELSCSYQLAAIKKTVVQQAKGSEKLEADLRLKEKGAAMRAEAESKRINEFLNNKKFSSDCNKAITEGLMYINGG